MVDTSALWLRLQRGDTDAFTQLYRMHAPQVYNHCYRRTLSAQDAEDLTAEAFAQAWRRRADIHLDEEAGGLPWLLVTANNLLHRRRTSLLRARWLLGKLPPEEPSPDHASILADRAQTDQDAALVAAVLNRLSRHDRDIVQLCVLDGLTPGQVAAASGEPAGTVRSRLSRALARARQEFDRLSVAVADPGRAAQAHD